MSEYSEDFLALLHSIAAKRPKTVIEHILAHGYVTSQELKDLYGYNHPPRAVRDVREHGIPLVTYRTPGTDGRKIAAYKFGNPEDLKNSISKAAGRTVLSKALKQALVDTYGEKCFIYYECMDSNLLQVDHRVPYEIGGEKDELDIDAYMLLCPSANRAKSWTCEHCENWVKKDIGFCENCFWANPENYEHVAGKHQKIIQVFFSGNEITDYEKFVEHEGIENAQNVIKRMIHDHLK